MYSYGSSARAGVGKRGHGGREYRPPRKNRRDPNATPPPLKQCSCLCQLDFPEYATTAAVRHHATFGGREHQEALERHLRSLFLVHLVIPGRKQFGPVAVVGESYRECLPAVAYLLQNLSQLETWTSPSIRGRIQRRVQDPNDITLEGHWTVPPRTLATDATSLMMQVSWLFQCPEHWNAMVCYIPPTHSGGGDQETAPSSAQQELTMTTLQITFDNFKFKMGNLDGIEIFLHDDDPVMALATGIPSRIAVLYEDMDVALRKPQVSTTTSADRP